MGKTVYSYQLYLTAKLAAVSDFPPPFILTGSKQSSHGGSVSKVCVQSGYSASVLGIHPAANNRKPN